MHRASISRSFTPNRWVVIKGQHPDPSVDAQIKQSIDAQLAAKGLTKADDTADLDVDYQTAISKAEKWEAYEDLSDTTFGGQRLPQHRRQKNLDNAAKKLLANFPPK